MIDIEKIWELTDGGRTIIEDLYPQSAESFVNRKNFRIRDVKEDSSASCTVFLDKTKTFWFLQDKGGSDTKAKNAILLVQDYHNLSYGEALKFIDKNYCNGNVDGHHETVYPQPVIKNTKKKYQGIQLKEKKKMSEYELSTLGNWVTPDVVKDFGCTSLDYYITKDGFKISSTETYPIYLFKYDIAKMIYQPFSKDYRFFWIGDKPDDRLFFDNKTKALWDKAKDHKTIDFENKVDDIILCSGRTDAMAVYSQGYAVCWKNSETAELLGADFTRLTWIAKNIHELPDIDQTGKKMALKEGMQFLNMRIIWLPDRLRTFRSWNGKPCKDMKEFTNYYVDPRWPDLKYLFKKLVETSFSLRFWNVEKNKNKITYEINNEQAYAFLNANGFYTLDSKSNKKEFVFIKITDNVVEIIQDKQITQFINSFLLNFLRENLNYYDIQLINTIHRSDQLRLSSLSVLKKIELDFKCYGKGYDHIFFKNIALRIDKNGIEKYKIPDTGVYVLKDKILDFDFNLEDPPFVIDYSETYKKASRTKNTEISDYDKYTLKINDKDFSVIKYLWNTGRVHWKKEEAGIELTELEKKEYVLHFISKVCAIGFALYRYKERGMPYFLYAMETEQGALGTNRGGTGKSFLFSMIEAVRTTVTINGRRRDLMDDKHIFSQVVKDVTDFVYYDDIGEFVDLHIFLGAISGKMEIRPLFVDTYMLEYEDSPKIGGSSNHSVRNIDPSIRRRLWFLGFSDYYHHEDSAAGVEERSIRSEFGKNLLQDFDTKEWNKFYNVMAWCMHYYLKFNEKVSPPIDSINKRNLQGLLGDDFIDWAEGYFTEEKINTNLDKKQCYDEYLETLPERQKKFQKASKFKEKLMLFAEYKDYIFNPHDLFKSESELKRNDIRETRNGKDVYCFHYRTRDYKPDNDLPLK